MKKNYFLRIGALGRFPQLTINHDRFEKLKLSSAILRHALAIEEKYEILISNFIELEKYTLNAAVSHATRNGPTYTDSFDFSLDLNIRLVNLLTAARLYTDQLGGHILGCVSSNDYKKEDLKKLFSIEYDSNPHYRFMVALRNYVQHRGIPVHRILIGAKWIERDKNHLEFSTGFYAKKETLALDKDFKKLVLDEIPDEVNLKFVTRSYIESLSRIHRQAREIINDNVESSRKEFQEAINEYREVFNDEPIGLCAYEYDNRKFLEEVSIMLYWDDIRLTLIKRNPELFNLANRYVTGYAFCD